MSKHKSYEPNLMGNYFGQDTATYEILNIIRKNMLANSKAGISDELIGRSKTEIDIKRRQIDESTSEFADDLNHIVSEMFGGSKKRRTIMYVDGIFIGSDESKDESKLVRCLIPIDLGTNPYPLFSKSIGKYSTIDSKVTYEQTDHFLKAHREDLRIKGFETFKIGLSKFFNFDDNVVSARLRRNDEIDLKHLTSLATDLPPNLFANGRLISTHRLPPSLDKYRKEAIRFVSYRLKQSEVKKLVKKLTYPSGKIDDKEKLSDWVAHRIVLENEVQVQGLESVFKDNPKIQDENTNITYIYTKDYYKEPKENGFKCKNVVVVAHTKGFEPCVREIQIVHFDQFHYNLLDPNSPAHWSQQKKKRKQIPRNKRKLSLYYEDILNKMFEENREFLIHI